MDFSPFAVGGAATRSDSFTKLRPEFASGVYRMVQDARAAGVPLEITSAYRSPDLQAQLFDDAVAKYGSPEAARKFVAPAGRSQHNFGTAVDFAVNGQLIRDPQSAEAKWIRENAAKYGLAVPMDWEPWQVELKGARAQTLGKGGSMLKPAGATPQMDKEEDKTDFRDIAGNLAIAFNSLRHRPDPNVTAAVQNIQQQRTAKAAKNKTMDFLKRSGRDDLVKLFENGMIDGKGAASIMMQDAQTMRDKGTLAATAEVLAKQFEAAGNPRAAAALRADPSAQNVNNASQSLFSDALDGEGFRVATPEEAAQYGAEAGQFDSDGRFYPTQKVEKTQALTSSEQSKAQNAILSYRSIEPTIGVYRELVEQGGFGLTPSAQQDVLRQTQTNLMLQMKELFNLGVLNGPDLDLMEKMVYDVTSPTNYATSVIGGQDPKERFNANMDNLERQLKLLAGPKIAALEETFDFNQQSSNAASSGGFSVTGTVE